MSSEDTLKNLKVVLDGTSCTIFMTTLTIWALFADDVRLSVVDDEADALFGIVTTVVFICFVLEIIACSLADPKYLALPQWQRQSNESLLQMWQRRFSIGSFFFWLDLISTISLLLELPFMQSQVESTDGSTDSTRAGRASRAGAKASKVIKVVRMTRLVRTIKLYKYFSLSWQQQHQQEQVEQSQELSCQGLYEESKDSEETPQAQRSQILELTHNKVSMNSDGIRDVSLTTAVEEETRVGSAMTDLTSRRVIILVLVMLITIPLIMDDAETANTFHIFIVELISSLVECGTLCTDSLEGTLKMTSLEYDVVSASHGRTSFYRDENRLTELRDVELSIITAGDVIVIFDVQDASMDDATLSCFLTVFVILLLAAATYILSCDMNHTVLVPIEKMVSLVKRIAVNPLGVTYSDVKPEDGFGEGMETTLLMQTINKLGRLMKVGFGDAGTAIISAALARSEGGKINLDLTTSSGGRIVRHIFGFCDVRQFTDTTECLQEEVMLFVNRIAHILHSIVVQCGGSANKNIGDAFLLTWELDSDARGGGRRRKTVKDMYAADSALYALLISLISIHRHNSYICNFSSKATEKLYRRFSSYRVRLGCGLHVGWAVEGALGSHRKIDATYLSPHVNMSEFLESSTKQYGVPLLMSQPFYELLSAQAQAKCRQVGCVASPVDVGSLGAKEPTIHQGEALSLYTSDIDMSSLDAQRSDSASDSGSDSDPDPEESCPPSPPARLAAKPGEKYKMTPTSPMSPACTQGRRRSSLMRELDLRSISTQARRMTATMAKQRSTRNFATFSTVSEVPSITVPRYTLAAWETQPELVAAQARFSNEYFRRAWKEGLALYVKGDWVRAAPRLASAKALIGGEDGPTDNLLDIMAKHGVDGRAPEGWRGYFGASD